MREKVKEWCGMGWSDRWSLHPIPHPLYSSPQLVFLNLLTQLEDALNKGFGARRTARNVYIDWHDGVTALNRIVAVVEFPAGVGALPHTDHPFGIRHLFVEQVQPGSHLLRERSGDNHQVRLTRASAKDLRAKAGQVILPYRRHHRCQRVRSCSKQPAGPWRLLSCRYLTRPSHCSQLPKNAMLVTQQYSTGLQMDLGFCHMQKRRLVGCLCKGIRPTCVSAYVLVGAFANGIRPTCVSA